MSDSRVVCDCRSVKARALDDAIDGGARTVDELGRVTGAGTGCGQCRRDLMRRLRRARWRRWLGMEG